jgi:C4-type Zn-finger protein
MADELLTREEREQLLEALEVAKALRSELARAKRAGIDVTELEARLNEAEQSLKKIKQVYFAGTSRI